MDKILKFLIYFCFIATLTLQASEEEPEPTSLDAILQSAKLNNGEIQEALREVDRARAQVEQAKAALFPRAQALILAAPIFEETGDALNSQSNWSKWGPFVQVGGQVVQPLYTFGQISSYRKAADNQVIARAEQANMKRADIIFRTKEVYYGYRMAHDLEKLVDNLVEILEEAATTAEKNLKEKKSNVKLHDVYKLKTNLDDLKQKRLLATQSKKTAKRALEWLSGMHIGSLPTGKLRPESFEKKELGHYLKVSRKSRPEFIALLAGQNAFLALRDARRAQSYPVIFLGAFGSFSWSPVRDKQNSIFANDPFNSTLGGIGLGVKIDLEWKRHASEAAEQQAEYMKLKAKESWAVPGIELQVKKAFWETEEAIEGLEIARRRKRTARKWFVGSAMGWSIGITEAKDLMEALEGDGLAQKNYIETVYRLNMAYAALSKAVGRELTELNY